MAKVEPKAPLRRKLRCAVYTRKSTEEGLEQEFKQRWISADNALYVLYCLKDCKHLSERLNGQRLEAIQGLLDRSSRPEEGPGRGIPLFSEQPEVGPTAQLLEIMSRMGHSDQGIELANFVAARVAAPWTMPQTFSWHLSSALAVPELRDQGLP